MLVLSRERGQTIVIKVGCERIVVKVLKTGRGVSKIGVQADPCVTIVRGEVEEHDNWVGNCERPGSPVLQGTGT